MQLLITGKGTFLKSSTAQSSQLLDHQRRWLPSGTVLEIETYGSKQEHYHVKFSPEYHGWEEGFVFKKHSQLVLPAETFQLLNYFNKFQGTEPQKQAIANLEKTLTPAAKTAFARDWQASANLSLIAQPEIETSKPEVSNPKTLAEKIVAYCELKGYPISRESGHKNIIYIEGMNPDGTLNPDRPNEFNDLRLVVEFTQEKPVITGRWEGTTEPGRHYTLYPMNKGGAARVAFGSYAAWRVGMHGTKARHEALVQVANVDFYRDLNKDFMRTGDRLYKGIIGMNQHAGYDFAKSDIRVASAGCLVGRTNQGHREFMALIKRDPRYVQNRSYIFRTAILPGNDLLKQFPN